MQWGHQKHWTQCWKRGAAFTSIMPLLPGAWRKINSHKYIIKQPAARSASTLATTERSLLKSGPLSCFIHDISLFKSLCIYLLSSITLRGSYLPWSISQVRVFGTNLHLWSPSLFFGQFFFFFFAFFYHVKHFGRPLVVFNVDLEREAGCLIRPKSVPDCKTTVENTVSADYPPWLL